MSSLLPTSFYFPLSKLHGGSGDKKSGLDGPLDVQLVVVSKITGGLYHGENWVANRQKKRRQLNIIRLTIQEKAL